MIKMSPVKPFLSVTVQVTLYSTVFDLLLCRLEMNRHLFNARTLSRRHH